MEGTPKTKEEKIAFGKDWDERFKAGQARETEGMTTFVITFASVGLRDGWVEVTAFNEDIVRVWANKEYVRWSDTSTLSSFEEHKELFPLGCLGRTTLHYAEASHV